MQAHLVGRTVGLTILAALGGLAGCSTLSPPPTSRLTAQVTPATGDAAGRKDAVYTVEVRSHSGKSNTIERALAGPLHAQEALDQVGALKKFRRSKLKLIRQLPNGGQHQMAIDYAPSTRRLDPEFDYLIHPGDRIIVTEDPTTMLDDLLDTSLRPVGGNPLKRKSALPAKYSLDG